MKPKAMCKRFFVLLFSAILTASLLCAQDKESAKSSSAGGKANGEKASSAAKTGGKTAGSSKRPAKARAAGSAQKRRVSPARVRRMTRAFVASTTLKPMAHQLIEARTPSAYAGVENYARQHAGSDAGAMAWLAIGYAHILDKEYAKAIPALQKAKLRAGELADYVRYFEALAYGGTGQSEKVVAALKGFPNESADSIFLREITAIYGEALTASGRAAEAVDYLEAHRTPIRADIELAL
ncbi:MAG: hypothetical protein ABSD88_18590, partial [Candidatus Korobacteraceae bacterium]